MTIDSPRALAVSQRKLRELEELYDKTKKDGAEDPHVKELTARSLKKMINQLKEEIIRFEAHAKVKN
jgi:hypothetical protein